MCVCMIEEAVGGIILSVWLLKTFFTYCEDWYIVVCGHIDTISYQYWVFYLRMYVRMYNTSTCTVLG